MPNRKARPRPLRAKLIFNPISGRPAQSPQQLASIVSEMQDQNLLPEVYMVHPKLDTQSAVRAAIRSGINLIVVAGGDGTIDVVAGALVGSAATLGIIPIGTRNNVAFNLGVPETIPEAVALLRAGRRLKIDLGYVQSRGSRRWFLEAASLGLISDLYPAADQLQHGDLGQIGTLLSTFVAATPSRLRVSAGNRQEFDGSAYMVLIANMPYLGPRIQVAHGISCRDSLLDVFIVSEMTKLDLISFAVRAAGGPVDDVNFQHLLASSVSFRSKPGMPVLADGILLHRGDATVRVLPRALAVMTGASGPAIETRPS